jgi:hypothetical protein
LRKEGRLKGAYLVGKEISIQKLSELVQTAVSSGVRYVLVAGGSTTVPVLVGSWAAGYLASQAFTGFLESLWGLVEQLLRELFGDLDELDNILASARSTFDAALDGKLRNLQNASDHLANNKTAGLQQKLDQMPNATEGAVLSSVASVAAESWSILNTKQAMKNAPPESAPGGDLTVYDVQSSGVLADSVVGKAWIVRYGLARENARADVERGLKTTGADRSTGITPTKYVGVLREYKVTREWYLKYGEGQKVEGFDRPVKTPIKTYP